MSTTLDLLQEATLVLTQAGSLKDRLAEAFSDHLCFIEAAHLPDSVRHDFDVLREAMNRERPAPRESAVRASVRKMSAEEANQLATLVVRMLCSVARSEVVSNPRQPQLAPIVKLFASEG
jgi:hypothetical protein